MNDQNNSTPYCKHAKIEKERRILPFFIEFVKFVTGFAFIISIALLALHVASAMLQ